MSQPRVEPPVSLADYAFVTAGMSDGLELHVLLEHRAVDPSSWPGAESYWLAQLMTDLVESHGELSLRLGELQAEARVSWARPIAPLDEELRAWVFWSQALSDQTDPLAWLAEQGLRPTDLLYLQRHWTERLSGDEALRAEQAKLLDGPAEPVDVPPPPPPVLRTTAAGAEAPKDDVDGTLFARVLTATERGGSVPFEAREPPAAAQGFRAVPKLLAPVPEPPPDDVDLDGTAAFEQLVRGADLPFFGGAAQAGAGAEPAAQPAAQPAAGEPSSPSESPAPALPKMPLGDAVLRAARCSPRIIEPPGAVDENVDPAVDPTVDQTVVGGVPALSEEALPFAGQAEAPPPAEAEATIPATDVGGTAFVSVSEIDFGAAMPFERSEPDVDATVAGGVAAIGEALPFSGQNAPPAALPIPTVVHVDTLVASPSSDRVVLPFVRATGSEPALLEGGLTLRQLAALTVEMELSFSRAAELLSTYGLTLLSFQAHNDARRQLTATDPTTQDRWDEAISAYRQWRTRDS